MNWTFTRHPPKLPGSRSKEGFQTGDDPVYRKKVGDFVDGFHTFYNTCTRQFMNDSDVPTEVKNILTTYASSREGTTVINPKGTVPVSTGWENAYQYYMIKYSCYAVAGTKGMFTFKTAEGATRTVADDGVRNYTQSMVYSFDAPERFVGYAWNISDGDALPNWQLYGSNSVSARNAGASAMDDWTLLDNDGLKTGEKQKLFLSLQSFERDYLTAYTFLSVKLQEIFRRAVEVSTNDRTPGSSNTCLKTISEKVNILQSLSPDLKNPNSSVSTYLTGTNGLQKAIQECLEKVTTDLRSNRKKCNISDLTDAEVTRSFSFTVGGEQKTVTADSDFEAEIDTFLGPSPSTVKTSEIVKIYEEINSEYISRIKSKSPSGALPPTTTPIVKENLDTFDLKSDTFENVTVSTSDPYPNQLFMHLKNLTRSKIKEFVYIFTTDEVVVNGVQKTKKVDYGSFYSTNLRNVMQMKDYKEGSSVVATDLASIADILFTDNVDPIIDPTTGSTSGLRELVVLYKKYYDLVEGTVENQGIKANKALAQEKKKAIDMMGVFESYFNLVTANISAEELGLNLPSYSERQTEQYYIVNETNLAKVTEYYNKYYRYVFGDVTTDTGKIVYNDILSLVKIRVMALVNSFKTSYETTYKGYGLSQYFDTFEKDSQVTYDKKITVIYTNRMSADTTTISNTMPLQIVPTLQDYTYNVANKSNENKLKTLITLYDRYTGAIDMLGPSEESSNFLSPSTSSCTGTQVIDERGFLVRGQNTVDLELAKQVAIPIVERYNTVYPLKESLSGLMRTHFESVFDKNTKITVYNDIKSVTMGDTQPYTIGGIDVKSSEKSKGILEANADTGSGTDISRIQSLKYTDICENGTVKAPDTKINEILALYWNTNNLSQSSFFRLLDYVRVRSLDLLVAFKDLATRYPDGLIAYTPTITDAVGKLKGFDPATSTNFVRNQVMSLNPSAYTSLTDTIFKTLTDMVSGYNELLSFVIRYEQGRFMAGGAIATMKKKYVALYKALSDPTFVENTYTGSDGSKTVFTLLNQTYLQGLATDKSLIAIDNANQAAYPTGVNVSEDTMPYIVRESEPEWATYNADQIALRRRQYGLSMNYLLYLGIEAKKAFINKYKAFYTKMNVCKDVWFKTGTGFLDQTHLDALGAYNKDSENTPVGAKTYKGKDFQEMSAISSDIWAVDENKSVSEFNQAYNAIVKESLASKSDAKKQISIEWKRDEILKEVTNVVQAVLNFSQAFKNVKVKTGKLTTSSATKTFSTTGCMQYFNTLDYLLVGGGGGGGSAWGNHIGGGGGGSGHFISTRNGKDFDSRISNNVVPCNSLLASCNAVPPYTLKSTDTTITVTIGLGGSGASGDSTPGSDGGITTLTAGSNEIARGGGGKGGLKNLRDNGAGTGSNNGGLGGGYGNARGSAGDSKYGGTGGSPGTAGGSGGSNVDNEGGGGGGGIGGGSGGKGSSSHDDGEPGSAGAADWGAGGGGGSVYSGAGAGSAHNGYAGGSGYAALIFSSSTPFPTTDVLVSYAGAEAEAFQNPPRQFVKPTFQPTPQWWTQQSATPMYPYNQTPSVPQQRAWQPLVQPQRLPCPSQQQTQRQNLSQVYPQQNQQRPLFRQGASLDDAFKSSLL